MGGALRVGTSLGDRWGVELEFARGATLENESTGGPRILPAFPAGILTFSSSTPGGISPAAPIVLNFRQRLAQRHQTLGAVAWIRQPVGSRVDLVYLGGVGFWRTAREQEFSFAGPLSPAIAIVPRSQVTRTTSYGAGPLAGIEARIGLTEHVHLVPGIRLHGVGDVEGTGWLLRAGVGLGWFF